MQTLTVTSFNVRSARLTGRLEELFRDHHALILRTAYGVTDSQEDAQDVLQTIFVRLLQRELPPDLTREDKAQAYLYRAAVNASLSILRERKRRHFRSLCYEETIAVHGEADLVEERHRLLHEALAELDLKSAEIVVLRHVHGLSVHGIAKLLGQSRAMIAVRLFRARARLKKIILASWSNKS